LPLGLGCGDSYQATVRQVSVRPEGTLIATAGKSLPPGEAAKKKLAEEDVACPGAAAHPKIRGTGEIVAGAKDAEEARLRWIKAANAKSIDQDALNKWLKARTEAGGQSSSEPADRNETAGNSREVRLTGRTLVAPSGWAREQPETDLCLAEFLLPRVAGDHSDAQLTVSELGPNAPRSPEELKSELEVQLPEASLERLRIGDGEVVLVESSSESQEAGESAAESGGEGRYRVLNATLFVGGKTYAINCTGPEATVGERTAEIRSFLQSLKSVE
jgi:hypothetical protein